MSDLHPAVVKLYQLELTATELQGSARSVSEYRQQVEFERNQLNREISELRAYLEVPRPHDPNGTSRARLEQLESRTGYLDAVIESAAARFEELNDRTISARTTAQKLREHLAATLDAGGFEP